MYIFDSSFDTLCEALYVSSNTGICILKDVLDEAVVHGIKSEIRSNRRNYVQRPYRFGTTVQGLSSWDFEREVMNNYINLRQLNRFYDRLSHETHCRLGGSGLYADQIGVNASYYPSGSVGIGPHRDNSFSVNFIAIFVISGCNDFFTARDKQATDEVSFPVAPGDCILMRGIRSLEERHLRPIHYVKQIVEDRHIITFREINRGLANRTTKPLNL